MSHVLFCTFHCVNIFVMELDFPSARKLAVWPGQGSEVSKLHKSVVELGFEPGSR